LIWSRWARPNTTSPVPGWVLYRAESLDEVREVVGGFFATCTDESIGEMRAQADAVAAA
jgi:hypothetical protein